MMSDPFSLNRRSGSISRTNTIGAGGGAKALCLASRSPKGAGREGQSAGCVGQWDRGRGVRDNRRGVRDNRLGDDLFIGGELYRNPMDDGAAVRLTGLRLV